MQSEQDIRKIKDELAKLTGFIGENGTDKVLHTRDVQFSCNVCDALAWILGEIPTVRFNSEDYLNLNRLKQIAIATEMRTGQKFADYQ